MVFDGDALRSELMHMALQRNKDIDFSVVRRTAHINENGEFFKYSLRSRSGSSVFVNEICKKYGGGGHPHAGAFISPKKF